MAISDASLTATLLFSRPQKYLILGETTSDDFLRCDGKSSTSGLQINVEKNGVYVSGITGGRYLSNCTPEMADKKPVLVNKAFCVFGIENVKAEDDGRYVCRVHSSQPESTVTSPQVHLRIFGECFLRVEYCSSHLAFRPV